MALKYESPRDFFPSLNLTINPPIQPPTLAPTPALALDLSPAPTSVPYNCSQIGLGDADPFGVCAEGNHVLEVARGNLELSLFVSLYEILDLEVMFDCAGRFTALLPTNKAVIDLGRDRLTELLAPENREELRNLLLYHVIPRQLDDTAGAPFYVETLIPTDTVLVGTDASTFDNSIVQSFDKSPCNGAVLIVDSVLMPGSEAPSLTPSSLPTLAPTTAAPSSFPSASPSRSLEVVLDTPFFIAYASANETDPSADEYEVLRQANVEFFTQIFQQNFTDFISLDFELQFFVADFDPTFNIFTQWLPPVFQFRGGSTVSSSDVLLTLQRAVTLDYVLHVRDLVGTAFADVTLAFLAPRTT